MKFSCNSKMLPMAALVLATIGVSAHAEQWVATATKAPRLASTMAPMASVQSGAQIHVAIALKVRNKAELDALTAKIVSGANAKVLSSAEFMSRYAPSADQVQAVVNHLTKSGFVNVTVADNRMLVTADGSADRKSVV